MIRWPLKILYTYGYWGSQVREDLCAALTGYDSRFWAKNSDDCEVIIERKIDQLTVVLLCLLYFFLLFRALWRVWDRILGYFIQ